MVRDSFAQYLHEMGGASSASWSGPATPIGDRLDRMTNGNALATWNRYRGSDGCWDHLRFHVSLKVRRRLTGAGYMRLGGCPPDEFEMILRAGGCTAADPIAWYVTEALRALAERRHARTVRRRYRLARRNGHMTYHEYRNAWCRTRGYRSLWHYRREQGWS